MDPDYYDAARERASLSEEADDKGLLGGQVMAGTVTTMTSVAALDSTAKKIERLEALSSAPLMYMRT